ncbi:MAG TPA: PilZ domain-containing protein [Terriglobales bacterium]
MRESTITFASPLGHVMRVIIVRAMEPKGETRIAADLPVRVWGMDADGKPFFQNAAASNLSSEGALLSRIQHPLKMGEVLGIQYGEKKARFEIKWVKPVAIPKGFEAGVRILPNQTLPWIDVTNGTQGVPEAARRSDKRRFNRHRVQFPIVISFPDPRRAHMQCYATDIGGRGCYVETLVPLQVDTEIIVTFWIDSDKLITKGRVRTSDPAVGMGIEFMALEEQIQKRLQEYLDKMDKGFAKSAGQSGQ